MDSFVIEGPVRIQGSVDVSGAKNAVLPVMTAALLSEGVSVLERVPHLRDTETMAHLLRVLGARVDHEHGTMRIDTSDYRFLRGAVRAGQDDARLDLRARTTAGAQGQGARQLARRLRLGSASGRSALDGHGEARGSNRHRARLHRRQSAAWLARRRDLLRDPERRRHDQRHDGGGAGGRHDGSGQCRP